MKTTDRTAAAIGVDVHRRFGTVTARNAEGKIAWRQRPEHKDRDDLRTRLDAWSRGITVILESSFGWKWMRYRMSLLRLQTGLKNRVHAILHRHGILHGFADLFGAQGRRMLTRLAHDTDTPLRKIARATLKGYLQLLDHLRCQIATVTRTLHRQMGTTADAKRLQGLPGVGPILAHTILAEVGDLGRFRNAKRLASYRLLAPRVFDSREETDEVPKGRNVGHIGRRTLKWAWIEAADVAVRGGGRFREIFDRYTDEGKRNRNRGYILVGHEFCRTAYAIMKKETQYRDDPPLRPGSSKRGAVCMQRDAQKKVSLQNSRPGTVQSDIGLIALTTPSELLTSK